MKAAVIFLTLALIIPGIARGGAFNTLPPAALSAGLGETGASAAGEVFSLDYNPAGLAGIKNLRAGFSYMDYYSLNLVAHSYAGFAVPADKDTVFGFSVDRLGTTENIEFMDYSEEKYNFGIAYRIPAVPGLRAGGVFSFYRVVSQENASGYGLSAGVLWSPPRFNRLDLGVSVKNFNAPRIRWTTGAKDRLPVSYSLDTKYKHLSGVSAFLSFTGKFNAGLQYDLPGDILSLRAGYCGLDDFNGALSAGMSIVYGVFQLDYAARNHAALGLSHFFTVNLHLDRTRF